MPSFHATVRAKSRRGGASIAMPSALPPPAAAPAMSKNLSAAWISAFDGMQPRNRQVPPGRSPFDQHGVEAELAGADRGDIAAGSAADDENARAQGFGHAQPMNSIAGCSSWRLMRWMNEAASQPSTMR